MTALGNVLSIGTDVVEVSRMRKATIRNPRILNRIFSEDELNYCFPNKLAQVNETKFNELNSTVFQRLAARFAAKESVLKALYTGLGGVNLIDIEVKRSKSGEPSIYLRGTAKEKAETLGINKFMVSLSHCDSIAQSFVIALK